MPNNLDAEITYLKDLNLKELHKVWNRDLSIPLPPCRSADTLRRILAWRLQEAALGGLSPDTKSRLRKLAKSLEQNPDQSLTRVPSLKPGTVLVREWEGVLHRIQVLQKGFEYTGVEFASLSEVARHITGTRWSGPLFFGLKR